METKLVSLVKKGVIFLGVLAVIGQGSTGRSAAAKKLNSQKVKIGNSIHATIKKATKYSVQNTKIAFVDANGVITGKKEGETTLTIKKNGKVYTEKVIVKTHGFFKKPLSLCADEIKVVSTQIQYGEEVNGKKAFVAKVRVKNTSEYSANKVDFCGIIDGRDVTFHFEGLDAKEAKTVQVTGYGVGTQEEVGPKLMKVVTGGMGTTFEYATEKSRISFEGEDVVAPEITGFIGKNSYNQNMPYQVVYSDDENYNFFKYIKARDDRGGKVSLSVDTSRVNFKKSGKYKIYYTAVDQAGNKTVKPARIEIRVPNSLDKMADIVLKKITKPNWSSKKKLNAIYNFTRKNISYVGYSNKKNWEKEAVNGLRYGKGDCFTYYAVARILLTRSGFPNIEVRRVKGEGRHWWNKVYIAGGWYHYDCGPRSRGGRFCLLTDAQMRWYSENYGHKYIWDYKGIPKSGTKKLSKVF